MTVTDHSQGVVRGKPRPAHGPVAGLTTDDAPRDESHPRLGSSRYGYTFRRLLLISDLSGIAVGVAVAMALYAAVNGQVTIPAHPALLIASVPLWVLLAHTVGLYHLTERRVDHSAADELGPVFLATTLWVWLVVLSHSALTSAQAQLLEPGLLWIATIAAVLGLRATARAFARGRSWFRRSVVLIGDEDGTEQVLRRIRRHPEWGLDPVAAIRKREDGFLLETLGSRRFRYSEPIEPSNGYDEVTARDIAYAVEALNVDRAIVTGAGTLASRTELTRLLARNRVCVDYVSGGPEALYSSAVLHYLEGLPILTVQPTTLSRSAAGLKRAFDVAGAGAGLIALSPLLAYAAVCIKLDSSGPVLFRQARIGEGGRRFEMLKFRTMVAGADALRDEVRDAGIHGNGDGMLKLRDDPRVTRFGAKLRRWSLDELPQLWNVVRGDMSLVGPRPLPLDEAPLVREHFLERTRVRPGITGPWQTHGRSEIPFEDMVKLDYTYVVGWSMREDLRLLLRTVATVARGRGAY